jgi:hypothetical protein
MPHEFHGDDVRTSYSKISKIVGHTDKFRHPSEKAEDLANTAYYENQNLDPHTLPTEEKVGPMTEHTK